MNDPLLSQEFAAVLKADAALLALIPYIHAGQSAEITQRPSLVVTGEHVPYIARRVGSVHLELRSRTADESGDAHGVRFTALWTKLLGAPGADDATSRANLAAAKVAFKAAIDGRGKIQLLDYGPANEAVDAGAEDEDLRTTLILRVAWLVKPPVV